MHARIKKFTQRRVIYALKQGKVSSRTKTSMKTQRQEQKTEARTKKQPTAEVIQAHGRLYKPTAAVIETHGSCYRSPRQRLYSL